MLLALCLLIYKLKALDLLGSKHSLSFMSNSAPDVESSPTSVL